MRRPTWLAQALGGWFIATVALLGTGAEARHAATAEATVPMPDFGGRPVIEALIDGHGPYRLLLDTGASRTLVSPDWVDGRRGRLWLGSLTIGAVVLTQLPAVGEHPFGVVDAQIPGGVLSASALPGYVVTLDFPRRTVSIRPGALPAADGRTIFEYDQNEFLPLAPVRVAGHDFVVLVDSGSPAGLTLPVSAAQALGLTDALRPAGQMRSMSGAFDVSTAMLPGRATIGTFTLEAPTAIFAAFPPGRQAERGNLGCALLRTFTVSLDSAHRRLRLAR